VIPAKDVESDAFARGDERDIAVADVDNRPARDAVRARAVVDGLYFGSQAGNRSPLGQVRLE